MITRQQNEIDALKSAQVETNKAIGDIDHLKSENAELKGRLDVIESFMDFLKQSTDR